MTRGKKTISSLSHTCLLFTSMRPRSFHRCRPYFMKIWGRRDVSVGQIQVQQVLSVHPRAWPGTHATHHGPATCPPCQRPPTPPRHPKDHRAGERADPNPYGRTNLILVTSTEPGKACQSCKRRQRGISRQQAGRQRARDGAGCVTFHPDMELAQLALQLVLQQTHVLGTDGRTAPISSHLWDPAPCQPTPGGCLTSVYSL